MEDTNQNGIPDTADRVIGLVLLAASIVLGAFSVVYDPCPRWIPPVLSAVGTLAGLFTVGAIPRPFRKGAAPSGPTVGLVAAIGLAVLAGGCTPNLANGYRGHGLALIAGRSADVLIRSTCKAKLRSCKAAWSSSSSPAAEALEAYRKCKAGCLKAVKLWVDKIAPGFNTGLALLWGSLETARLAKKKEYTIPEKAKPLLCALIKAPAFFQHLFGAALKSILAPILSLKGLVCNE